jgi:lipopolysaccharide export system protein LptA
VQEGDVVIVQTAAAADDKAAPKGGKPQQAAATTKAYARRADYDAAAQLLRLTGSPRVDDGTVALAADAIDYHRDTQAAEAVGNVKATYGETAPASSAGKADLSAPAPGLGGSGPTHVIAANALLDRAHGVAVFRGQARLWQGPNSVAAPVIELTRSPESLKAYAEPAATDAVTTVLASTSGPQRQATVLRVRSRQMTYTDADRKAVFAGAVAADDPSGVVHADQVVALLLPAPAPGQAAPAAAQNPSQIASQNPGQAPNQRPSEGAGRIDRILATGHVALQQPGRRGVGEKLLYTAQDGKFELTGTPSTPPHLYDHLRGDVSGASLIFNSRDDSVSVSGGQSPAVTNTRTAK